MKARFFRSDAMSERLGETPEVIVEAEWFQLTYDGLRVAPDGNHIAHYFAFEDVWRHNAVEYSDVVLYDEDEDAACRTDGVGEATRLLGFALFNHEEEKTDAAAVLTRKAYKALTGHEWGAPR